MSTEFQVPSGPPWHVDDVADVHAGVYPPDQTAELLERIAADEQGAAILAALDSTVDALSLQSQLTMPDKYVLRLDAAIAAAYPAASTSVGPPRAAGRQAPVLRGGLGVLLQPGAPTARPGLPRPAGPPNRSTGGPVPSIPGPRNSQPRNAQSQNLQPTFPARRPPVIPSVLPGPPLSGGPLPGRTLPGQSPSGRPLPEQSTTPVTVTDLQKARDRTDIRSTPVRVPSAPGAPSTDRRTGGQRVGSLEAQRIRRRRWTGGLLAAAAVVAVGTVTAIAVTSGDHGPNMAGPVPTAPTGITQPVQAPTGNGAGAAPTQAFVLEKGKYAQALDRIEGQQAPAGALANPVTYAACLAANSIDIPKVKGVTPVTFESQQAFAIAVDQGTGRVKLFVVGARCGTAGADLLDSQIVNR